MNAAAPLYHPQIAAEIVRLVAHGDGSADDPKAATAALEGLLSQCDDLLEQMNVDARTAPDTRARKALLARVEMYDRGVKAMRKEFTRAKVSREALSLLILTTRMLVFTIH